MTQDAINDLRSIQGYPRPPVKRAAYSDRAAWLMAIMAELAYTRFDQDDDSSILSLARELAELTDREQIVERLRGLAALLGSTREGGATEDNALLRSALDAGEFRLKGVLFDATTDTQGYVAVRRPDDGPGMVVLAFRGTQQVKDWMTNLDAATTPDDLHIPGYRQYPLTGERIGSWSIRVSGNWRLVFRFRDGGAVDVDLVDYH